MGPINVDKQSFVEEVSNALDQERFQQERSRFASTKIHYNSLIRLEIIFAQRWFPFDDISFCSETNHFYPTMKERCKKRFLTLSELEISQKKKISLVFSRFPFGKTSKRFSIIFRNKFKIHLHFNLRLLPLNCELSLLRGADFVISAIANMFTEQCDETWKQM